MTLVEIGSRPFQQEEQRFFIDNNNLPSYHEGIRLDRLVILPAYKNVIYLVLERHIDKEDSSPVIEVGCGTGSFSRDLAPDWLKSRIVSFDLNLPSLRVLVESDNHAQAFAGSSYRIPIKDQGTTTMIGYSSFDSMASLPVALEEAKKVLTPGGKLILFQDLTTDLYDLPGQDGRLSVEDYHRILAEEAGKAGFSILEGREDYLYGNSVEAIKAIRERVPDFDLDERQFPLVAIWDKGHVSHPYRAGSKEREKYCKEETMADLTQGCQQMQEEGLLDNFGAKGGELIAFLTMRYLVLQKPLE